MRPRTTALTAVAAVALAPALVALGGLTAGPATATTGSQVCEGLSSGKIDTKGDPQSVTVYAPAGRLVAGYCVKAGSTKQGDGPVYALLATEVPSFVITHPSGKAVSHYSVWYVDEPTSTPEPTPTPEPDPQPAPTPEPEPTPEPDFPVTSAPPVVPWHWDWTYADPTCDALTVSYPANLPENQANDVNIRIRTNRGEVTLNYHNNETTWSGTTGFTYSQHPRWPAGVTSYTVTWIQVAGTNYHWQEGLDCRILTDGDPDTLDAPLGVTSIDGYSAGRTRLATGRALPADSVVVDQSGLEAVVLQRQVEGVWHTVRTVATTEGVARVAYPRERRKGTYAYRLLAPRSESVTGVATKAVTVKVVTKAKKRTRH